MAVRPLGRHAILVRLVQAPVAGLAVISLVLVHVSSVVRAGEVRVRVWVIVRLLLAMRLGLASLGPRLLGLGLGLRHGGVGSRVSAVLDVDTGGGAVATLGMDAALRVLAQIVRLRRIVTAERPLRLGLRVLLLRSQRLLLAVCGLLLVAKLLAVVAIRRTVLVVSGIVRGIISRGGAESSLLGLGRRRRLGLCGLAWEAGALELVQGSSGCSGLGPEGVERLLGGEGRRFLRDGLSKPAELVSGRLGWRVRCWGKKNEKLARLIDV